MNLTCKNSNHSSLLLFFSPTIAFLSYYLYNNFDFIYNNISSYITGISRWNRNNERVYKELNKEYGKKEIVYSDMKVLACGMFHNDKLTGLGNVSIKFFDLCKVTYSKGIFKNNLLCGPGSHTVKEWNNYETIHGVFKGMFRRNRLDGKKCQYENDFIKIMGEFKRGYLQKGTIQIKKYNENYMSKKFSDIKEIKGTFLNKNSPLYNSAFVPYIELNGTGSIQYTSKREAGVFKNGILNGFGMRTCNEITETGSFKNGKLHGSCKMIFNNVTLMSDFENGIVNHKYDILLDKIKISINNNYVEIIFENKDKLTGTISNPNIKYIVSYLSCRNNLVIDDLINYEDLTQCTYTIHKNNSISNMNNMEFKYWLFSKDDTVFKYINESNLADFIDGKLYMLMGSPNDFKLVNTNEHILNKLLSFKNVD